MPPIDEKRDFIPLNIAVVTVSDTRTLADDRSGEVLIEALSSAGHGLAWRAIVKDDVAAIQQQMRRAMAEPATDVLICTGGTGITARDVTPEAFAGVVEKRLDGFGEIFRMQGFAKIGTSAIQSRACAGIAGGTIMFVLPGSPGACKDGWTLIAEMLDNRYRPCNVNEMRARL